MAVSLDRRGLALASLCKIFHAPIIISDDRSCDRPLSRGTRSGALNRGETPRLDLDQLRVVGVLDHLPDQAAVILALAVSRRDAGEERDEIGAELVRDLLAADKKSTKSEAEPKKIARLAGDEDAARAISSRVSTLVRQAYPSVRRRMYRFARSLNATAALATGSRVAGSMPFRLQASWISISHRIHAGTHRPKMFDGFVGVGRAIPAARFGFGAEGVAERRDRPEVRAREPAPSRPVGRDLLEPGLPIAAAARELGLAHTAFTESLVRYRAACGSEVDGIRAISRPLPPPPTPSPAAKPGSPTGAPGWRSAGKPVATGLALSSPRSRIAASLPTGRPTASEPLMRAGSRRC